MLRYTITAALLFAVLQCIAFGGNTNRTYGNGDGGYYYFGIGGMMVGKAVLGGGELLISGNVWRGRLLAGVNVGAFSGTSPDNYGFTLPGVKYNYRAYEMGVNVGARLFSGDKIDFTAHLLFGKELLVLGTKDTTADCNCDKYHALLNNYLWYVRPAISFNNRKNFAMMASYNFLFNDTVFNPDGPAFGNNAADFNGPMMSMIWITNRRNRSYHWHHHC